MIDKKTIVSFLSKLTHGQRKVIAKQTIHPRREWFIGLSVFVLVTILGGIFSLYNFTRYSDIHLTLRASEQAVESYKEQTVKKALSIFGEKKKRFQALENEGRRYAPTPTPTQEVTIEESILPETLTSDEVLEATEATTTLGDTVEATGTTTAVLEVF